MLAILWKLSLVRVCACCVVTGMTGCRLLTPICVAILMTRIHPRACCRSIKR
nr:MAG TPA: hypothetical protein [Caudoviricetes sp.]DAX70336.1 MAG TPA: hypothetical protein [Caudoviricetes sp.]